MRSVGLAIRSYGFFDECVPVHHVLLQSQNIVGEADRQIEIQTEHVGIGGVVLGDDAGVLPDIAHGVHKHHIILGDDAVVVVGVLQHLFELAEQVADGGPFGLGFGGGLHFHKIQLPVHLPNSVVVVVVQELKRRPTALLALQLFGRK